MKKTKKVLAFPRSEAAEIQAFAAKILPLPAGITPSTSFLLRTRALLLDLPPRRSTKAA
jgi:hypothetical protein